jgi:hypothetical protein
MTAKRPKRRPTKNRRPHLPLGELISLLAVIAAVINALAHLIHG